MRVTPVTTPMPKLNAKILTKIGKEIYTQDYQSPNSGTPNTKNIPSPIFSVGKRHEM